MRVVCCSSGCCGVKHIRDFPLRPSQDVFLAQVVGHEEDEYSTEPAPYVNFVAVGSPTRMTAKEAFEFLLEGTKEKRPRGMITVNLVNKDPIDPDDCYDSELEDIPEWGDEEDCPAYYWRDLLKSHGFEETQFVNSNSGALISHFVLVYGDK